MCPIASSPFSPTLGRNQVQLSETELLRAYRQMKLIREFEERIQREIMLGRIPGFTHVYSGQEANAVGVCEHLSDKDYIISTHRGHGHCIAKGCDVDGMMKELFGSADGLCKGRGGSMHVADISKGMLGANGIVGAGPPISVGAALACKMRGDGGVAVSFSGDGSTNQGTTFEAMNMAVVLEVPQIFVFEDNGYAEHTGASFSTGCDDIAARSASFGFPVFSADGTDFFDVYDKAGLAIEHARSGNGPAGIYTKADRFYGHFVGDPMGYRDKGETEYLKEHKDCLKNFRSRVVDAQLLTCGQLDALDEDVLGEVEAAVEAALGSARPDGAAVEEDVYVSYA